jgi:hypothetical protein
MPGLDQEDQEAQKAYRAAEHSQAQRQAGTCAQEQIDFAQIEFGPLGECRGFLGLSESAKLGSADSMTIDFGAPKNLVACLPAAQSGAAKGSFPHEG